MALYPINPSLPVFSQILPTVTAHIFTSQFTYKYVNFVHYTGQKIAFFSVCQKCSVTQKYAKMRFRSGLRPGPRWDSWRHPRPPSRLARGHPSSDTTPLSAFGASILAPLALATCAPAQAWCPRCFRAGYGPEHHDAKPKGRDFCKGLLRDA